MNFAKIIIIIVKQINKLYCFVKIVKYRYYLIYAKVFFFNDREMSIRQNLYFIVSNL